MHDPEKSDSGIVVMKPMNKAGRPAAELVEPRPGTKGNADQQSTHRTHRRVLHLIKMWLECAVEETDDRGRKRRTTEARDNGRGTRSDGCIHREPARHAWRCGHRRKASGA